MTLTIQVIVGFLAIFTLPRVVLDGVLCGAEPLRADQGDDMNDIPRSSRKSSQNLALNRDPNIDMGEENGDSNKPNYWKEKFVAFESDLSDLKNQLAALMETLHRSTESESSEPKRVIRSIAGETVSGYFGHINAAAYGNCTCRGEPGPAGPPGIPGRDGRDGRDAPVPCHETSSVQSSSAPEPPLQSTLRDATAGSSPQGTSTNSGSAGGVFVRWGRSICPDGSELVYEGVIGGSYHNHDGGGAKYQCLPLEPTYDDELVTPGTQDIRALLYGAEYEIFGMSNQIWTSVHDQGPPCAVCMATGRPTVLMIPARNVCPSSRWNLEYSGLLMAGHHGHKRTDFICVDGNPESIPRTAENANGALLYPVEGRCINGNSLPCGPYIDGHELSCVVCSM